MEKIEFRVFQGPLIYWTMPERARKKVRFKAMKFINDELSLDQVVSITETEMLLGPFTVAVWYRISQSEA